jgi:opacity protein-like surface antigen
MIRTIALAAAAAFALAVPATAADWNGFYVGKLGFYNHTDFDFLEEAEGECEEVESEEEAFFCLLTGDGIDEIGIAKVFGYNWQTGNFVLGIDGMVAWQTMRELDSIITAYCELVSECDDFDLSKISVQAMGRIGVVISDNVMIYGAAGVGASRFVCTGDCGPPDEWYPYAAIAAGIEVAASEHFLWRTHVQLSRQLNSEDPLTAWAVATGGVWAIN